MVNACIQSNEELLTNSKKRNGGTIQRPFKRLKCRKSEGPLHPNNNTVMSFLFESFEGWRNYCEQHKLSLSDSVLEYEHAQKGRSREDTIIGLRNAWQVMKEAVKTGLERKHDFAIWND